MASAASLKAAITVALHVQSFHVMLFPQISAVEKRPSDAGSSVDEKNLFEHKMARRIGCRAALEAPDLGVELVDREFWAIFRGQW